LQEQETNRAETQLSSHFASAAASPHPISVVHFISHSSAVFNWPPIPRRPLHTADLPSSGSPHTAAPTDPAPFPTETGDQPTLFPPPAPPARHDRSTTASSFPVVGSYTEQGKPKEERQKHREKAEIKTDLKRGKNRDFACVFFLLCR